MGYFERVRGVSGFELDFEKKAELDKEKLEGARGKPRCRREKSLTGLWTEGIWRPSSQACLGPSAMEPQVPGWLRANIF